MFSLLHNQEPGPKSLRSCGLRLTAASRGPGDIFYILYRGSMGIIFFLIPYYVTVPADDLQLTGYPRLLLSWHGAELNVGWALSQRTALPDQVAEAANLLGRRKSDEVST